MSGERDDRAQRIKVGSTPISHEEIVDEIKRNIRKFGGEFGDWRVGTAKAARGPCFHSRLVAELGDGLIYREAFTADAARAIRHHLVRDCGLQPDLDTAPESGKIASACRKAAPAHPETRSVHPRFRKLDVGIIRRGLQPRKVGSPDGYRGMNSGGQPRVSALRELMGSLQPPSG